MSEENTTITINLQKYYQYIIKHMPGFIFGTFFTILLGNQILVSDIFPLVQNIIMRINNLPYDMTDKYYYITTPQNKNLPMQCDKKNARAIGGFVDIKHQTTIINPHISLVNGVRKYCIPDSAVIDSDDDIKKFTTSINWFSQWAFINEGTLYAYLEIGDNNESLLKAKVSDKKEDSFNANMLYISDGKSIGKTNIKFSRCKKDTLCDDALKEALKKL